MVLYYRETVSFRGPLGDVTIQINGLYVGPSVIHPSLVIMRGKKAVKAVKELTKGLQT